MSYNFDILLLKNKNEHDKWRIVVITVTFLFFLASFILVVLDNIFGIFYLDKGINCSLQAQVNRPLHSFQQNYRDNQIIQNSCQVEPGVPCQITCEGIKVSDIVQKTNISLCETSNIFLWLDDIEFVNESIQEGWLAEFEKPIFKLKISNSLKLLGKRSFSGYPFQHVDTLTLENTNIDYLEKDSFNGSSISKFEFRFNSLQDVNFEYGALDNLRNRLESFQLQYCNIDPKALKNLTGSSNALGRLQILDLRFNSINYIINDTFNATPSVIQLYLGSSKIEYVEKLAFSRIGNTNRLILDISSNQLTTLPEGLFSNFRSEGSIHISKNPWNCDCNLVWFKEFYELHTDTYFDNGDQLFECYIQNEFVNYTDILFCPSTTISIVPISKSTSIITTTEATTLSTNTEIENSTISLITQSTDVAMTSIILSSLQPDDFVIFSCEDCSKSTSFNRQQERLYSQSVMVRNGSITYDFYRISETPYYDIILRNSAIKNDYMIWINIQDHDDIGCLYNIQELVTLNKLNFAQEYVICLLQQGENKVSPFDCTSLRVPPTWNDAPWIFNKDKILLIILFVIILLIVIAITIAVVYYMIKKNPKLIQSAKVKTFDRAPYQYKNPPSLYSTSDGYLTPRLYERINSINYSRKRISKKLSTISERDFEGAFNVVYNVSQINERELHQPPPLPPNHPSKWKQIDSDDETVPSAPEEKNIYRSKSFSENKYRPFSIHASIRSKSIPGDEEYLDCFKI